MANTKTTPFLTIKDACTVTGLSQHFLRQGVRDGSIPHIKSGTVYYINLPALLEKLGVPSQSQPVMEPGRRGIGDA